MINNREKRRTPFIWKVSFRVVLILAAIAMVLSYISIYVNPSKFALPLFFGLYFIPILAINLLLLLIALIKRSKSVWIPIIVILPALLFTELFYKISSSNIPDKEGIKLKIESFNVGMFAASRLDISRATCRNTIFKRIIKNKPDIVCMQEFFIDNKRQADTILQKYYPYRYHHLFKVHDGRLFGNITLSKFPIKSTGKISFSKSTNLSIYTDIEHYGRIIRIYNNHLESYNISFTSLVKRIGTRRKDNRENLQKEIMQVHEKVLSTFIRRSGQVNMILENIRKSNYPSIICGDFNDTPMSYTYHKLSIGRKDTFKESGKGFGSTFAHLWPVLRIDYILYPQNYSSINHTIDRTNLSDHYSISAEIII